MAQTDPPNGPKGSIQDRLARQIEAATDGDLSVVRVLGEGRTGIVYLAEQHSLDRKVSVKVLRPRHARTRKTVSRFKREARAMAGSPHPGIVSVFYVGETADGIPFFVMEYVDGESLEERLGRKAEVPLQETVRIIGALADALTHAHGRGLIHRDVKPANVLIERRTGRVLLTDFGLAKTVVDGGRAATLTGTGEILGTPEYLSPEQAESGQVDARSDQYSLAVMAYEMLAGRRPFLGPTAQDYVRQHAVDTPPSLRELDADLRPEVARVVNRGLMKEPGARFASAEAFGQALRSAALSGAEARAPAALAGRRLWRLMIQSAAIYAGAAWGVLEALTWILETFDLPMRARQPALWVVLAGFPLTMALLWFFMRPDGEA